MIDYSKWGLDNRKLIYFLVAVLTLGGIWAVNDMSKLEDPEIKVKMAAVVTVYPGASAHQVELEVTDLLEKKIREMDNIESVESRSTGDLSLIYVALKPTVPDNEVEQYWDMLRRKVGDAAALLPAGARTPIVQDDFGNVYGLFYAVTNDGYSEKEFADYMNLVKREVQNIEGISQVSLYGEKQECIYIQLAEERMANLGVMPAEVLATIQGQNETVYAGYFESGNQRIRVNLDGRYKSVQDISNLLIQGHENDQVRLGDIAFVEEGFSEPIRNAMRYDDNEAVGLSIAAQSGMDIVKIGKAVEQRLEQLKETQIPAGVEFHKVFFQSDRVSDSLGDFAVNLILSILIVVVALMFTMGWRSGYILGITLLVTVMGSFLVLHLFNGTLQRVSIGSFVIAMGMLVDNSIVIIDGILVDLKRGVPRKEALTAIGRKTAMPLLGATLIAILAFYPIFLSPDTAGVYVRDLFIVLAISLLLSWILALTYVPLQAERLLKVKEGTQKEPYSNKWYTLLRKILGWTLSHRILTVLLAVVLVAVSAYCYRFLPQGFFPDMTYNQLYLEYQLPEGTNSTQVAKDVEELSCYLRQQENVTHVTTSVGGTPSRYNLVRSVADPSLAYGELIVDFTSSKALVDYLPTLQDYLVAHYPQAFTRAKRYNLMYKKHAVEAQFEGPDPAVLRRLTAQTEAIMQKEPDLCFVRNSWEPQAPMLNINYNQPIARSLGLSRSDVGMSLLSATDGIPMGVFYDGSKAKSIVLKTVDKDGKPIASLSHFPVFSLLPPVSNLSKETLTGVITGSVSQEDLLEGLLRTVPLSQTASSINVEYEEPVIWRYNGQRALKAQASVMPGASVENTRRKIATAIESIPLPDGYSLKWMGEAQASADSTKYLFKNFPLAIILMIAILIMLFKDYRKPIIIICSIPLLLVGVIAGILVSGKTFGFVPIVGVLGLIGMMIKNGVVLMDEISAQLASGKAPVQALLDSSVSRFLPVMMASLTTVLGMIPLINDDMFGSMAVTIMGGLFVGTLVTLLFIPTLYALFFHIKKS